jgi:hypothetical protein
VDVFGPTQGSLPERQCKLKAVGEGMRKKGKRKGKT